MGVGIVKFPWLCCRRKRYYRGSMVMLQKEGGIAKVPWLCCIKEEVLPRSCGYSAGAVEGMGNWPTYHLPYILHDHTTLKDFHPCDLQRLSHHKSFSHLCSLILIPTILHVIHLYRFYSSPVLTYVNLSFTSVHELGQLLHVSFLHTLIFLPFTRAFSTPVFLPCKSLLSTSTFSLQSLPHYSQIPKLTHSF